MKSVCAFATTVAVGVAIASCSSGGGGGSGVASPSQLVATCDMICSNVVATCASSPAAYQTCLDSCNGLNLVPASCLNPFLSYLTCVAGATSVRCGGNGQYVLVTPPQCEDARRATLTCNATPGLVAACVAVPGNGSCAIPAAVGTSPVFCVGAPHGCVSPSPNPIGIGVYCCSP